MKAPSELHPNFHEMTKKVTLIEGVDGTRCWTKNFYMLRMKTGASLIMQMHVGDIKTESNTFRACRIFEMKYDEARFCPFVIPINPFIGFNNPNIVVFEWKDVSAVICAMDSSWDDMIEQSMLEAEDDADPDNLTNAPSSDAIN